MAEINCVKLVRKKQNKNRAWSHCGQEKREEKKATEKQSSPTAYKQSVAPYPMRG